MLTREARCAPPRRPIAAPDQLHASALKPCDHDLTVVVPAFNEERRLPRSLAELARFLAGWQVDHRVIVVDDGSQDATCTLTAPHGPRFSTRRLPRHRGKGAAVRAGMLAATGRVVAFTDADLPYSLEDLRTGYEWIRQGNADLVLGARDIPGSRDLTGKRPGRKLMTLAFRQVVRRLISREIADTQCGLKLFSRRAALEIFSRAQIDGFAFDAEVVLLAQRLALACRRLPVTLVNDCGSTVSAVRHALPMFWEVVLLWARRRQKIARQFDATRLEPPDGRDDRRLAA